jgi:dihydroorotase
MLIRGGRLVDPAAGIDAVRDVLLTDGRVTAVDLPGRLDDLARQYKAEIFAAKRCIVAPGLVDIHVHLREPGQGYKETIATGTAAAAAGGFTSVCAMPNTIPVNDSAEITRWMQSADRNASAHVFPICAATIGSMGERLAHYKKLKAAGAVAVSDDGKPILEEAIMRKALGAAAECGLTVIQHAEDTRLTGGCSMNAGPLAATLTAVRRARDRGLRVTCEVAPHHFLLTEAAVDGYDTNAKMNPPLRSEADRDAMIAGILDGTVDCIATDHAPHATHEKEQEFERAPNGITGLETALGLSLSLLHKQHGLSLSRIIALLSSQPAALLALNGRGTLAVGAFADVVIFDPEAEWLFRAERSKSKSKNTPFEGWTMSGSIRATISEGRVVFRPDGA